MLVIICLPSWYGVSGAAPVGTSVGEVVLLEVTMLRWKGIFARSGRVVGQPVGEIRANVTVGGDISGQLAVGSHIVQMRVDTVLGNLITVLPKGARAKITARRYRSASCPVDPP